MTKIGSPYLSLTLSDGETDIASKQWNYVDDPPSENTVIKVQALLETYQGEPQLNIQRWRAAEEGECLQRFIPMSPCDIKQMKESLLVFVGSISNKGLRKLVEAVLECSMEAFCQCPAAMYHHHNYIGGLLEHTLEVVRQAQKLSFGEDINDDLLLAGAILHDIGKIWTYDWSGCSIIMTDLGKMVGHIVKGIVKVSEVGAKITELNDETIRLLLHLIASHHGKLEWGSPVEPVTKEALILHKADLADVEFWKIAKAASEVEPGQWTGKILGINREFYVPAIPGGANECET
ncbi:MAG: HD domain-containing protein [Dehalococcoidales bacterium]